MKIWTMLFVGLLLEGSLFASEKKCIWYNGIEGKKPAVAVMLYSSYDLLQARGSSYVTVEERQREESLASACLQDYQDNNATLSTSPDFKRIEETREFKQKHRAIIATSQSEKEGALQKKREAIIVERQRLKDVKEQRLLDKQDAYKEFVPARTRYAELDFYPNFR